MSYNWRDTETATRKELLSDIAYAEICFHTHIDYVGDINPSEWIEKVILERALGKKVEGQMDKQEWHEKVQVKLMEKYNPVTPVVDWTKPYIKQRMEVIKLLHEVLTTEYDCTEYSFEMPDWIDRLFGVDNYRWNKK